MTEDYQQTLGLLLAEQEGYFAPQEESPNLLWHSQYVERKLKRDVSIDSG